jgi:hypothetical protein
MKLISKTFAVALLAGAICGSATEALMAEDANGARLMKPLQGVFLNAGQKRAVGYFYDQENRCKLVVTVAEPPSSDDSEMSAVLRREASIKAGGLARFDVSEGQTFEFTCAADAQSMTMKAGERIAAGP